MSERDVTHFRFRRGDEPWVEMESSADWTQVLDRLGREFGDPRDIGGPTLPPRDST